MSILLHLVYIHGFQGNDTSFQSFPLHLQERISSKIADGSAFRVQSSLYPTYKSAKPLSNATKDFLGWLSTQPEGPVILLGHSMGGLLAAEAALDASNASDGRPKRIVGVVAFDTPFLGMHPHVVVTGIASLVRKNSDAEKKPESERELNPHPEVHVVESSVTDDWEEFKKKIHRKSKETRSPGLTSPSYLDIPPHGPSPQPSHDASSTHSQSSSTQSRPRSPSPLMNRAVDFVASRVNSDDPFVRWFRKHADDPLGASKRWVIERFQFGGCMFDPSGLKDRYLRLVDWKDGLWINYWTETVPPGHGSSAELEHQEHLDNDAALVSSGIFDANSPEARQAKDYNNRKHEKHRDDEKAKLPRHFVVLPTGLGQRLGGLENWEKILIANANDEVKAHTGLFIPSKNLDYDRFVDNVADRILDWAHSFIR